MSLHYSDSLCDLLDEYGDVDSSSVVVVYRSALAIPYYMPLSAETKFCRECNRAVRGLLTKKIDITRCCWVLHTTIVVLTGSNRTQLCLVTCPDACISPCPCIFPILIDNDPSSLEGLPRFM